eukprot:TRINITY_DN6383_c0_g3_i2.p1 TRINITY_DN6383_c0_g3~~TRINITY_DN6383_c0_g3_i2.p1  ORF type:complete len:850 (+),score=180.21 TRINITY_DN6383_c0_g3_i2:737-3286(+)
MPSYTTSPGRCWEPCASRSRRLKPSWRATWKRRSRRCFAPRTRRRGAPYGATTSCGASSAAFTGTSSGTAPTSRSKEGGPDGLASRRIAVVQVQLLHDTAHPGTAQQGTASAGDPFGSSLPTKGPSSDGSEAAGTPHFSSEAPVDWQQAETTARIGREFIEVIFSIAKRLPSATIYTFDARSAVITFGASASEAQDAAGGLRGSHSTRHSEWVEEACVCALEIREELSSRSTQWGRKWGAGRTAARIAVVHADALAGMLGTAGRRAFHVMGRAVDLARKAVAAEPTPAMLCNAWAASALSARCELCRVQFGGADGAAQGDLGWDVADDDDDDAFFQVAAEEDEEMMQRRREDTALSNLPPDRKVPLSVLSPRSEWRRLGGGSCGEVYRAEYGAGRSECAVKELRAEASGVFGGTLRRRVMFLRELHHLNLFRTPHIVNFYGWAQGPKGELYLLMEYCSRGSLQSLAYSDKLSPAERGQTALAMALSVAQALSAIHETDKVHLDVATRNVLVNEQMDYKLADVGLLCDTGAPAPVISVPWAPPEAVRAPPSERRAAPSHDVWSFGMLVYEVLAGGPPYAELRRARARGPQAEPPPDIGRPRVNSRVAAGVSPPCRGSQSLLSLLRSPPSAPQSGPPSQGLPDTGGDPAAHAAAAAAPLPPAAAGRAWRDAVVTALLRGECPAEPPSVRANPLCGVLWTEVVQPCWERDPKLRPGVPAALTALRRIKSAQSSGTYSLLQVSVGQIGRADTVALLGRQSAHGRSSAEQTPATPDRPAVGRDSIWSVHRRDQRMRHTLPPGASRWEAPEVSSARRLLLPQGDSVQGAPSDDDDSPENSPYHSSNVYGPGAAQV